MQQVSAFSRPQTVPAVPIRAPKSNLWILSSWRDLILYVGTPLLLVPIFALAQAKWSAQDIYIFVSAFGAMGHHLPGMIRAYGDRALFERFRWRFILAPLFLLGVCVAFYFWDLKGIILIVFFWGVWHGMMQTYGFCRIYDAKAGSFAAITRRLDFAACGIWFATAIILSAPRMTDTLTAYYATGAPFIPPWMISGLQRGMLVAAIAVSILFLANFAWMWTRGKRPNPVKLALLATSIGFWWYCNNWVTNILAGIALFEVFHDVQYLSLVWIYNRNRVEKDSSIGGFMRFVFRRSGSLVGLYIGLVFAYGSIGYFNSHIGIENVKRALLGVVAASGLLHFYYDGFIWKVREKSTRQSLGLAGGTAEATRNAFLPGWMSHGLKWAVIFVIPLTAFWFGQMHATTSEVDRAAWIVADLPQGARQHYDYGASLQQAGKLDEAEREYHTALRFDPDYTKVHLNLASLLVTKSKMDQAEKHFLDALRAEPNNGEIHAGYAYLLERLGRTAEAESEYQNAVRLTNSTNAARVLYTYGAFLEKTKRPDEAIAQYQKALRFNPNSADTHSDLANVLFLKGDLEQAKAHYSEAVRLQPKSADFHSNLGSVFLQEGKVSQAILQYEEALRLDPGNRPAQENLRLARTTETRFRSRSPQ